MPRFTLSQLVTFIGVFIFIVQLILIRTETKNIINENKLLAQHLQSFMESQLVKEKSNMAQQIEPMRLPKQIQSDIGPPIAPNIVPRPFPNSLISNQNLPLPQKLPPAPPNALQNMQPNVNIFPMLQTPLLNPRHLETEKRIPKGKPLVTSRLFGITAGAGLGNQLFELVSLIGIASQISREPFLNAANIQLMTLLSQNTLPRYPELLEQFAIKFDSFGTTLVAFHNSQCCRYDNVSRIMDLKSHSILLDGVWFQSYKYFHHLKDQIRQWVTPPFYVREMAKTLVPEPLLKNSVICVHTRRGDFVTDNYHKPSDEGFTLEATQFLVRKNLVTGKQSTVVIMGNDPIWASLLFMTIPSINIITNSSPEQDLSFSQQFCDNVLITAPSSTFGFWLAYLAKTGASVYYRDIYEMQEKVLQEFEPTDFFPKEWFKLKYLNGKVSLA